MVEIMIESNGIGLAAPQIGISLRIFVSNVDYEDEEGEVCLGEPKVYINPEIRQPSRALVERNEACLSMPELVAPVLRPLTIIFKATDLEGKRLSQKCRGFPARCFMHETDHLNGVLFVDRVKGKKRKELEAELHQIKQQYYRKSQ